MELAVPLERFIWENKNRFRDSMIGTWELMDEEPYIEPRETPYYDYLVYIKKTRGARASPVSRTLYKMALYNKIKTEGFCPYKQTRMTCTFNKDRFYIRNGHHRLSMIQHWKKPDPLIILLWIPEGSGKTDVYM